METEETKICACCKDEKTIDNFYKTTKKNVKGLLVTYYDKFCNICRSKAVSQHPSRNTKEYRENQKQYHKNRRQQNKIN
jgi:hypothetical protein